MEWQEKLEQSVKGKKVLFLGVGNEMKADDGTGKCVLDRLKTEDKLFCGEMPENFISKIKKAGPDVVILIDSVDFNRAPGEICLCRPEVVEGGSLSTHSISLSLMQKLLPGVEVYLLGIQPKSLEFGKPMSREAMQGAENMANVLNRL
ncbi:hydrogenase maturation protease [Candidatus Micrarchaeota archaeon]|nr:hydrogenase maturation protease [Candidatus Micrarchaeota archaeon]